MEAEVVRRITGDLATGQADLETVLVRLRLMGATPSEIAAALDAVGRLSAVGPEQRVHLVERWLWAIGVSE